MPPTFTITKHPEDGWETRFQSPTADLALRKCSSLCGCLQSAPTSPAPAVARGPGMWTTASVVGCNLRRTATTQEGHDAR